MNWFRSVVQLLHSRVDSVWGRPRVKRSTGFLLVGIVLCSLILARYASNDLRLKPGQVSPRDITSPVTAVITDEEKTRELKDKAAASVQKIYQEDKGALAEGLKSVDAFYGRLAGIRKDQSLTKETKKEELAAFLEEQTKECGYRPENINYKELARYLLQISDGDLTSMHSQSSAVLADLMQNSVTSDALPSFMKMAEERISRMPFASQARQVMTIGVVTSIKPNMVFNREATEAAIAEKVNAVQPVQRTILQGQIILRTGDVVTDEHIEILQKLGLQRTHNRWLVAGGSLLFVFFTLGLTAIYLRSQHREIYNDNRRLMLLALIFIIIAALARLVTLIKLGNRPEINALIGYLIPVAAGSMLVAILLDVRLAYFITAMMSIYAGLMTEGNSLAFAFAAFASGVVGVLAVSRINQTTDLARAGFYVALADIIAVLSISFITSNITGKTLLVSLIIAVLNGLISAVLMIGLLPYLETAFSVTSMIKLLELSNPNQQLLRRLLMEAPGTYHHSIMVGNLAEAAAPSVDANSLLVRVGALYHDIGKIKRPYFFVENQAGFENPHEKIAPSLSALIITSHIRDGVEMAREKKLPAAVVDIIEQHHGNSLVKYFYSRALEEDREGAVSEDTFRYEGPKPQTKEAALIMLADSVEAGVRSISDPTPGRIEGMVHKIIKDKLNDGQLEECDLTFRDLKKIAESFSKALVGIYHKRVEYPENMVRDLKKRDENGADNNRKQAKG